MPSLSALDQMSKSIECLYKINLVVILHQPRKFTDNDSIVIFRLKHHTYRRLLFVNRHINDSCMFTQERIEALKASPGKGL